MTRETLLFYSEVDPAAEWQAALREAMPDIDIRVHPDIGDPDAVCYVLAWQPPIGFFAAFRNLKLVINLGAGVDALLDRGDLPNVPITRLAYTEMSRMMAGYVLFAVLRYARDMPFFARAQKAGRWEYRHPRRAGEISVGVLGLGELGGTAAAELARQGFDVQGWSRSPKTIADVTCVAGDDALPGFLARSEILVLMLPLTARTHRLIDAARLSMLPHGAKLINVSRGTIVDQDALLAALRDGRIAEATLDVFETEPLPDGHPFWTMDNVLITPHLASVAVPSCVAPEIAENIRRLRSAETLPGAVDRSRGY